MPIVDEKNQQEMERYETFVRTFPHAVATQDPAWFRVKQDWQHKRIYLENGQNEIVAAMSIIFKEVVGGRSLAYAPRGPVCDFYDADLVMRLLSEAQPAITEHRAFVLRLDPELSYDETLDRKYRALGFRVRNRGFDKQSLIQPRYNMMLDIQGKTWEELMAGFSEKTRYNIRYAARKGVTVRWSRSEEDLKTFFEIYQTTCVRDKIGARPQDYFLRMLHAYNENQLRIYIAEHEGQPLSAAVAVNYGGKMWYLYGASSNEKRNLMPNYAMQAEMIKWGLEEHCSIYDFGGVFVLNKENGLYKFKEGFCRAQGVTELAGEYDFVYNNFWYRMFTDGVPILKKVKNFFRHK